MFKQSVRRRKGATRYYSENDCVALIVGSRLRDFIGSAQARLAQRIVQGGNHTELVEAGVVVCIPGKAPIPQVRFFRRMRSAAGLKYVREARGRCRVVESWSLADLRREAESTFRTYTEAHQ